MKYLACFALIVGTIAPAVAVSDSPPPPIETETLSSGYMRHLQNGSSSVEILVTGGSTPTSGKPLGGNRWTFDPGPGRDTETSLAVDARDPDRVLVAWQEDITRIWTARTQDGGRNWTVELLQDPAAASRVDGQEGFDPTAAIGPDGTMYVLMGVTQIPGGLTLVRLDEKTWTFHPVDALGDAHAWDAMHLAVAPDTGELYAVAQSIGHRGIGFWKSSDRGESWSLVRFPLAEDPQGAAQVARDGFDYWPRVAAGPEGGVLIVTKAFLGLGNTIRTTASSDGGETFSPVAPLTDEPLSGRLVGVPPAFDGTKVVAGFVTDDIVVAETADAMGSWQLRRFPRPEPEWAPDWSTVAARRGTIWILHTEENSGPSWRALLTRIRGDSIKTKTLASTATRQPRGASAGDEYGGLAVGKNGCVWASWAQPGTTGLPVIMVQKHC